MKLHQLRYLHEVVNQNLNISEAADVLFTSQPGISKQIRLFEEEIGVPVFVREGKRLKEITVAGKQVLERSAIILSEIENIRNIGKEFAEEKTGSLTIATTHTQASYALPKVIKKFLKKYNYVKLNIKQGYPSKIVEMVMDGEADIAIATEAISEHPDLISLPCYHWNHCAIVPATHPLLKIRKPSLKLIASYPILTYDFAFAGRSLISQTFERQGLTPNVVFTALDADVIKTYVELGLGVGLVAAMAFDKRRDQDLRMINLDHLFESSTTYVGLRRGRFVRGFVYDFIELFAPFVERESIMQKLQ